MLSKQVERAGLEIRRGVWIRATDSSNVTGMFEMRQGGVQRKKRRGPGMEPGKTDTKERCPPKRLRRNRGERKSHNYGGTDFKRKESILRKKKWLTASNHCERSKNIGIINGL